jgi:O-acetyl-ADP-ribose deacetylase (regulator of RNase III)
VITYVESDIFSSPAQTLVNTVNTVGVMGKGIAKTFKSIYPEMYEEYRQWCESGELSIGSLFLYRTAHKWVLNFPTKRHWRQASRLADIAAGLDTFCQTYADEGITSIAFPQLGCGNGGLDWERQVRPVMERSLGSLPVDIYIHVKPDVAAETNEVDEERTADWLRGEPQSRSYEDVWKDLQTVAEGLPDWSRIAADGTLLLNLPKGPIALRREDLFVLWHRLRSSGYLTPDDVSFSLEIQPEPVLDLLASLRYVTTSRVLPVPRTDWYDGCSTRTILAAPEAHGIRLVPPLLVNGSDSLSFQDPEDETSWNGNRTIGQLPLFSPS